MKALVLNDINQAVDYQDINECVATENEAVVSLAAAALNHRDVWIRKGMYAGIKFPTILGSDGAGYLDGKPVIINPSIGWNENNAHQPKDYRILGLPDDGTFAEKITINKAQIFDKPPHLSMSEAAALPLAGLTAYRALFSRCEAKANEKVLISGIGGGVALFAMQFAIAAGCEVYVTSGSEEKIAKAIALGAKGGESYKDALMVKNFQQKIGGFDVIIDSAAGDGFANFAKLANSGGRIAFYGGTNGAINGLSPQLVFYKQLSIFGSTMGNATEFRAMLDFVTHHQIKPIIDSHFALAEGDAAFNKMENGDQFGKIVLDILS
jgi:zinc-binding alcohol dehydrogenase/oxidoreductase